MNSQGHFICDPPLIPVSCVTHTFVATIVCHLDYDSNNQQGVIYFMDAMEMWPGVRWMFMAYHILCRIKYSCITQQGVLVLIWL